MTEPTVLPDTNGQRKQRRYFVLLLATILALVIIYMVTSIVAGLVAGILLWVTTRWIYDGLLKLTGHRRGLSAGLSVLATLLLVIVPLAVVVLIMTADATRFIGEMQTWIPTVETRLDKWMRIINRDGLTLFGYEFSPEQVTAKLAEWFTTAGQFLVTVTQRTASSIMTMIVMLFVALYTLYFFYVDGDRFIGWFKDTVPLEPKHSAHLIDNFFTSSIATIKTIGVIGAIQGVAAGIAYVIIGVPAPFFLTVLTIIATVIPALGASLVMVPVAIGLFVAGQTGWAIALLAWCVLVVSNLDNFLRPYLLHKSVPLHQLVIFVVTLGGIARYGFFGVFIGPVVAALFNASLDIYKEIYPRLTDESVREPEVKASAGER